MTAVRALVTIGLAGFWFLLTAPPMFMTPPGINSGVDMVVTGAPVQPIVVRVDPASAAYRAGLRTGDTLRCLSVRDATLIVEPAIGYQQGYRAGTPLSACVQRNGTLRTIQFVAQAGPPIDNTYGSNALSALRVCVFMVFFLTGIALVLGRPSPMTWIFFAYCIGNAPSFASGEVWTILPSWQYAIAGGLPFVGTGSAVAFLLLFSVLVPNDRIPDGWRRIAFYAACTIVAADLVLQFTEFYYTSIVVSGAVQSRIDEALTALTILIVLTRLATMHRTERARFGWAAFAIIFGVIVNDMRNVFAVGSLGWLGVLAADLTIVMPLCLMYAILKRHVIDVRFVISRTVVYASLTTLVVAIIGAVDWMTSAYLSQVRVAMAIDAGVTIGLAFVLHRTYRWLETTVDFILFRRKHDAENYLERLARTLLRAQREDTIDHALVHAPCEKLDLTVAGLFRAQGDVFALASAGGSEMFAALPFDRDHELVRFLATERTKLEIRDLRKHVSQSFEGHGISPALAIPIFQGDDLTGFAVYGIHRDGTRLDPDEVETLERLCETAAQAYVRIELLRYRALESTAPALA